MRGTISLEVSPKRCGQRKVARRSKQSVFRAVSSGLIILSGVVLSHAAAARAAEDEAKVSITPMPQRPSELTRRAGSIRVDVNLVQIPVMVTDPYEHPVLGLKKSDFHVFEDGVEREISQFISEEAPISVGIVFDSSASMRPKMDQSVQAVREFLKMSLPGDEFFLTKFSDRPQAVFGFTTEAKDIEDGLSSIQPAGWTALFDAISLGIHQMKHAALSRKVLLVMSDGGDNDSRYTERELRELVKEADVRIFSISILDRSSSLETLAEESGGRAFRVRKLDDLPELASNISVQLHSQYLLGYTPAGRPNDGLYRKVKVELAQPSATSRLRASWKHGYYSPTQ
jgi:Ca-activated chloride channel homolog